MTKTVTQQFRQMHAALFEIRAKAATMENGGAWAAEMAGLCLGTLTGDETTPQETLTLSLAP